MSDLVFLDIETTGLDPDVHEVWEAAWSVAGGPATAINTVYLPHDVRTADPKALELNGYHHRAPSPTHGWRSDLDLRAALTGVTVVGANPAFDTAFLRKRWGAAPWHYRLLDIEAMAVGVLGYERPAGLASIARDLRSAGHEIPEPDHSSAGDVATLRAVYEALRMESGART